MDRYGRTYTKVMLATLVCAGMLMTSPAAAVQGANLRQITGGYSQGSCSINVGIAFDGTNLIITCYDYNVIDLISPSNGSVVGSRTIPLGGHFGAAAWDATRNKLWLCSNSNDILLVDLATSTAAFQFTGGGCFDGLAYDGTDDTLWMSADASSPVNHYSTSGTPLGSFPVNLGGYGNSGIAVGGPNLFLANDGGSQIYTADKNGTNITLFATFPARLEDLECDDITFASQGVGAIWSIDAYDRTINAWETAKGLCGFGGLPSGPPRGRPVPVLGWTGLAALGRRAPLRGPQRRAAPPHVGGVLSRAPAAKSAGLLALLEQDWELVRARSAPPRH